MFKTLIYFDKKRITEYKSLIERKKAIELKNMKISNEKVGKAQVPLISGGLTGKSEMEGEILENYLLDCEEFENLLKDREDYFDFTEDSFDIETIQKSCIIRFEGTFNIPVEFDMYDMINRFRPVLVKSIDTKSAEESEILKSLLGKESTKVPIFIENEQDFNERLGFSKINSKNLCCDIEQLEDFENEPLIFIAKLISRKDIENRVVIVYDVLKDLFSMGRAFRRQLSDNKIEGINNISIDENFMTLEVLAVYQ